METGKIDREKLYEITRVRCPHLDTIAEEISALSARLLEDAIREDKTRIFALDYEVMSQMFADAASEGDMRLPIDKVLSDRLRRSFFRAGLRAENIIVCGDRKRVVIATGEEIARTELRPSDIRMICENICGIRFAKPSFMLESGKSAFILESLPLYEVESVMKQIPKQGEIVCGDSVSVSVSHDDYFYAFLCDGMGSGEEAALTSKLCRIFLEKMLVCGNRKSTTLSMLNHLLCSRNTECFATVDLCEIDLVLGIASFLKSGAVPSFVMRAGKLYKITSGTFPIGILPQVSADVTDFELCVGDVILMCSDGIVADPDAADGEDAIRFLELVTREWSDNLEEMAEKILRYSSDFSLGADDMTVALLRIKRRGEHF
jgi:stage II sporulation protein E